MFLSIIVYLKIVDRIGIYRGKDFEKKRPFWHIANFAK